VGGTRLIVPAAPFTSRADAFFAVGPRGRTVVFAAGQGEDSQYLSSGSGARPRLGGALLLRNLPYAVFDLVEPPLQGRLFFSGQTRRGTRPG